jgi:polyisoprenyl-phosphate glycosyltransferase
MTERAKVVRLGVEQTEIAVARLPRITLIIPVLNEEDSIGIFLDRATALLQSNADVATFDFLFVNDGSRDASERVILAAAEKRDDISLISLSRNFGKEAALIAGMSHATGDAVIPLDVDLQDPPEVISEMIAKWQAGARIVNARRSRRDGDSWLKAQSANAFYRLFNALAEQPIPRDVGDFRLMDREVVKIITQLGERSRCNKSLFSWVGFETAEVTYHRPPRAVGTSRWNYWKLTKLALDAIFSSTTVPLRIWTYLGIGMGLVSFVYSAFLFFSTLFFGNDVPGYASTVILILIFGGLNMCALGIIGEYIGRIYVEVRQRPLFIVRSEYRSEKAEG